MELGQASACQSMSSEIKLHFHLIQGSRLAVVITEHVKKCTQETLIHYGNKVLMYT